MLKTLLPADIYLFHKHIKLTSTVIMKVYFRSPASKAARNKRHTSAKQNRYLVTTGYTLLNFFFVLMMIFSTSTYICQSKMNTITSYIVYILHLKE